MENESPLPKQRLASLDALRGFDLFVLVALGPLVLQFIQAYGGTSLQGLAQIFTHKEWEGFSPWDLIMPLFVFMSGASIPFALARVKRQNNYPQFARRLLKRVVLLWLLGMICQGNLLGLDPHRIYLYSNTLQSIAIGYLIASLFFMFTRWRTQVISAIVLLLVYWAAMECISIDGYGGGDYTPQHNLAEWIDLQVLGRFRDGATVAADGSVNFAPWYHYTWILSSINFGVTALTGLFAGSIAKARLRHTTALYLVIGLTLLALGWLWNLQLPVIKTIWTSSMVLVSSGWCFVLMGLFYYLYDVRHITFALNFLKVYGMNSITAYMVSECINFRSVVHSFTYGLEPYVNEYYPLVLSCGQVLFIYLLLRSMKRHNCFLKV